MPAVVYSQIMLVERRLVVERWLFVDEHHGGRGLTEKNKKRGKGDLA